MNEQLRNLETKYLTNFASWDDVNNYIQEIAWWQWMLISIPVIYTIFIISYLRSILRNDLKFMEHPVKNLHEKYKPFERVDRKFWNACEIYFCGVFLLPLRVVFILLSGVFLAFVNTFMACFSNEEAEQGCIKRGIIKMIYRTCTRIWMLCYGVYWIPKKNVKIQDFEETYPYDDYKDRKERAPIIVCNHIGYLDTIYMTNTRFVPSLTAKAEIANYPILGKTGSAIQCIFIDRNDRKSKDGVIGRIKARCDKIKEGQNYPSLLLFPEGTTTNGKYLVSFKKGAFAPLQPIKIFVLKMGDRGVSPYLDENVGILKHAILSLCNFYYTFTAYEFDTYYPDHLNLQSEDDWEIYADKIKHLMIKAIDAGDSQSGYRDCKQYEEVIETYRKNLDNLTDMNSIEEEITKRNAQPDEERPLIDDKTEVIQYGSSQ